MRLVLAYDVVKNKERGRFFKRLKRLLRPVQKSVFEGNVDPALLDRIEALVARELDLETDSVRMYPLCEACAARTRHLGTAIPLEDPDDPIIL